MQDSMHHYVIGLTTLETMMRMLLDDLDRGDKLVYLDEIDARVHF